MVAERYGVWVEKSMYGRKYMGVQRTTYLIDKDGRMVYRFVGYVDWDSKEIRSMVDNVMNGKRA